MKHKHSTPLVDRAGNFNRAAIALEARRMFEDGKRLDLGLSQRSCMARAWARARHQRSEKSMDIIGAMIKAL